MSLKLSKREIREIQERARRTLDTNRGKVWTAEHYDEQHTSPVWLSVFEGLSLLEMISTVIFVIVMLLIGL